MRTKSDNKSKVVLPYVYEPAEDTFLILDFIDDNKFLFNGKKVLDVGTGTGILAARCADFKAEVTAVDINSYAISVAKKKYNSKKIKFKVSDLFSDVKGKFDIILFNPPYLPEEKVEDPSVKVAVCGGRHGYELLEKFFSKLNNYLKNNGFCVFVFSSLTNKNMVKDIILKNGFLYSQIKTKRFFFETLFLFKVWKQDFLKLKHLHSVRFYAKGKRGLVFKAKFRGVDVAVKVLNPSSRAKEVIVKEGFWLEKLNKHSMGPKLFLFSKNYIIMEFVDGFKIIDFFSSADEKQVKRVILKLLEQCALLDSLGLDKEELHHPQKHIIIRKQDGEFVPVMIDFERVHNSKKPKNLTQFLQFLTSKRVRTLLDRKVVFDVYTLRKLSRLYKKAVVNRDTALVSKAFSRIKDLFK